MIVLSQNIIFDHHEKNMRTYKTSKMFSKLKPKDLEILKKKSTRKGDPESITIQCTNTVILVARKFSFSNPFKKMYD